MTALTYPDLPKLYDDKFYEEPNGAESAKIYLAFLWQFLQPNSVVDVGCGRGEWLKAAHELGSSILYGLDGGWNTQAMMTDRSIEFLSTDLNKPFSLPGKVDLAITLEVAEHLEPATAPQFIQCMAETSDMVLFSAAYSKQGGVNHINEQPHSYWAHLFAKNDFVPFDLFRSQFWDDKRVCYYYRQNTFLYLRNQSMPYRQMKSLGWAEIKQIAFMNCVHPDLFEYVNSRAVPFREHLNDLFPSLWRGIKRRWKDAGLNAAATTTKLR